MKKYVSGIIALLSVLFIFSGCGVIGDKSASLSVVYGVTAMLSLLLLIGYCCAAPKKDVWMLLLFASVFVVNIGYFTLSISQNIEEALLANRISYFGSVFLPMSMLLIILKSLNIQFKKILPAALLVIGIFVLFVAASPGYLDIYYKEVSFEIVNGVSTLCKVYGPWHKLYLYYLMGYFAAMIATIVYAMTKRKGAEIFHALILLMAVFVNIGVWLIEQLVDINFEMLSVSYIISEMFLLGAFLVMENGGQHSTQENIPDANELPAETDLPAAESSSETYSREQIDQYLAGLEELTRTERVIYEAYISGEGTKEIMNGLNIKENTLKYHNKNLYGKLGVSSRKQLTAISKFLDSASNSKKQ